jgi:hypothetical protein
MGDAKNLGVLNKTCHLQRHAKITPLTPYELGRGCAQLIAMITVQKPGRILEKECMTDYWAVPYRLSAEQTALPPDFLARYIALSAIRMRSLPSVVCFGKEDMPILTPNLTI